MLFLIVLIGLFSQAHCYAIIPVKSQLNILRKTSFRNNALPWSIILADLDSETLDVLGDVAGLNEGLDTAINTASNPATGILTKIVSSPAILAIPIVAGLLVAFGVGYFISSYGQGRDD